MIQGVPAILADTAAAVVSTVTIKIISVSVHPVHTCIMDNRRQQTEQVIGQDSDSSFQPQKFAWREILGFERSLLDRCVSPRV